VSSPPACTIARYWSSDFHEPEAHRKTLECSQTENYSCHA
jgi:hypothetical protein